VITTRPHQAWLGVLAIVALVLAGLVALSTANAGLPQYDLQDRSIPDCVTGAPPSIGGTICVPEA
jgi:hypothetical protein